MEQLNYLDYKLPGIRNKSAVVTGGSCGIGRTIVRHLAFLGAKLAVIDISETKGRTGVKEIKDLGGMAEFYKGDVTHESSIKKCMKQIYYHFGSLDILVTNAGISSNVKFDKLSLENWRNVIDVNLTGSYICIKSAIPYFEANSNSSIIMISSGSAITGSGGSAAYAASKGGINSLVRALSRELAPKGTRVNGVAPRAIKGELLDRLYSKIEQQSIVSEIPLKRLGTEEDVAHVVSFLASDLSNFITGEVVLVDGGRTYCQ